MLRDDGPLQQPYVRREGDPAEQGVEAAPEREGVCAQHVRQQQPTGFQIGGGGSQMG